MKRLVVIFTIVFALSITAGFADNTTSNQGSMSNQPISDWVENSNLKGYQLRSLSYNDANLYLAVGTNGIAKTSTDGISWTEHFLNEPSTLTHVIYTGTDFMVVGNEGTILRTKDGISWIKCTTPSRDDLYNVTKGANGYVAIGKTILYSKDGMSWNAVDVPGKTIYSEYLGLLFDGTKYIVTTVDGKVLTSADGSKWEISGTIPNRILSDISWNGSLYIMLSGDTGEIYSSRDGKSWALAAKTPRGLRTRVIWDGNRFVVKGDVFFGDTVYGNSRIFASSDGTSWEDVKYNISKDTDCMIMEYFNGTYYMFEMDKVYRSNDLRTWNCDASILGKKYNYMENVIWVPFLSQFFMIDTVSTGLLSSNDGKVWEDISSSFSDQYSGKIWLQDIIFAKDKLYLYCMTEDRKLFVLTSSDGTTWTRTNYAFIASQDLLNRYLARNTGLSYDNGSMFNNCEVSPPVSFNNKFYSRFKRSIFTHLDGAAWGGEKKYFSLLISDDGTTWNEENAISFEQSIPGDEVFEPLRIISNGKTCMVYGISYPQDSDINSGKRKYTVFTSNNMADWKKTYLTGFSENEYKDVFVANGKYVVFGFKDYLLVSDDGYTFKEINTSNYFGYTDGYVNDLAWANGIYVAVGDQGLLMKSNDLIHWVKESINKQKNLKKIVTNSANVVIAADNTIFNFTAHPSKWASQEYAQANASGLTSDKLFLSLQDPIRGEEMCELSIKLYAALTGAKITANQNSSAVQTAQELGLVSNVTGSFLSSPVSKENLAAIFYKVLAKAGVKNSTGLKWPKSYKDVKDVAPQNAAALQLLLSNNIFNGSTQYVQPKANVSREAADIIAYRILVKFHK